MSTRAAAAGSASKDPKRFSKAFSSAIKSCGPQVQLYGKCVTKDIPDVVHKACEKEFTELRACMKDAIKKSLKAAR